MSLSEQQRKAEMESRIYRDALEAMQRYDIIPDHKKPITQLITEKIQSLDRVISGETVDSGNPSKTSGEQANQTAYDFSRGPDEDSGLAPPSQDTPAFHRPSAATIQPPVETTTIPQTAQSSESQAPAKPVMQSPKAEATPQAVSPELGNKQSSVETPRETLESPSVPEPNSPQDFFYSPSSDQLAGHQQDASKPSSSSTNKPLEFSGSGISQQKEPEQRQKSKSRERFEAYRDKIREDFEQGKLDRSKPPIQGDMLSQWKANIAQMRFPQGATNALGMQSQVNMPGSSVLSSMDSQESFTAAADTAASSIVSTFSVLAQIAVNLSERVRDIERTLEEASV